MSLDGWRPGPPGGGRTHPVAALASGLRRFSASLNSWLLTWLTLSVVARFGAPEGAGRPAPGVLLDGLLLPLTRLPEAVVPAGLERVLAVPGGGGHADPAGWAVLAAFEILLAGGALTFLHSDAATPVAGRYGWGCGEYAARFGRLALLVGIPYAVLLGWGREMGASPPAAAGDGASTLAALGIFAGALLLTVVADAARVRTVLRRSRSMLLEAAKALATVARNPLRVGAVYLALLAADWSVVALLVPSLQGRQGISVFLITESIRGLTVAIRMVGWAGLVSLIQGLTQARLARS